MISINNLSFHVKCWKNKSKQNLRKKENNENYNKTNEIGNKHTVENNNAMKSRFMNDHNWQTLWYSNKGEVLNN
jgi:hypothetical protein